VREFFSSFREAPVSVFETDLLSPQAVEITLDSGAVVYDALFLALAEEAGTLVVAAGIKLLQTLPGTSYARLAYHLADVGRLLPGTK
jgi:hypothetical protein